jgi:hypothetical protein
MTPDCSCRAPGLCGACTPDEPSHTESRSLAELMRKFAEEPLSEIDSCLQAEQYMSEIHAGTPRGARHAKRADELARVGLARRGFKTCDCGGLKRKPGGFGRTYEPGRDAPRRK